MPNVVIKGLTKKFADQHAIDDINLTIQDGEFFTLLGPSGCGKSTTLACIAGLERPNQGVIEVGDETFVDINKKYFVPPESRNLGMVFQTYALWPHMTVASNLALPLKIRSVPKRKRRQLIDEVLDNVELRSLGKRYPHELSGGQQQRVALARTLVYSPSLLLLDEPLSNLDAKLREHARGWLKQIQKEVGITTIYVTHDQVEALSLSDRIAVMRDGHLLQVGTPKEIYGQPKVPEVADFIGQCNFVTALMYRSDNGLTSEVSIGNGARIQLDAPAEDSSEKQVTLGIRAESLSLTHRESESSPESINAIPVNLQTSSYVGGYYEYTVTTQDDQSLVVHSDTEVHSNDLWLKIPQSNVFIFPGDAKSNLNMDMELGAAE